MKKFLKVLAGLLAVFFLILAAAGLYIKIQFPPERIKAIVIAETEKTLRRKLELRSAAFGIWSGLRIEGVRISERPDFSQGEFLAADAFKFSFAWMPLLQGKLAVSELALEGARATVRKRKDGSMNISDLTENSEKTGQRIEEGSAGASALAFQVDSIRIQNARFRYVDEQAKSETVLNVPMAAVDGFKPSGRFRFSITTALEYAAAGKDRRQVTLEAKGTADLGGLAPEKLEADIEDLALKSGGLTVSGKLNFKDAKAPKIEGSLKTTPLDSKTLAALAGEAMPKDLQLPQFHLSFSVAQTPPAVSVKSFKLEMAGLIISGNLKIPDLTAKAPRIEMEAASNTFDIGPLADIHSMTRGKGLAGKGSFKLAAKGQLESLDVPVAELKLELAPIKHDTLKALAGHSRIPPGLGLPAIKLAVSVSKTGDNLDLKSVSLVLGDLAARLTGRIAGLKSKNPDLRLALETENVSFAAFTSYVSAISNLRGQARLSVNAAGTVSAPKVSGVLDLKDAGAAYLGQRLENFTGAIRFTEAGVDIPKLTGKVNGGDLTLAVSAGAPDPKTAVVTLRGTLSVLDAGALEALGSQTPGDVPPPASGAKPEPYTGPVLRTSGEFIIHQITHPNFSSGKAAFRWDLTGVTPEFKLMDGSIRLDVGSGKAVKLLARAKQKGGLLRTMVVPLEVLEKARGLGIPGLNIPPLDDIPFDKITCDYVFRKGVMTMQPSLLEGPTLRAESTGAVDLPASKLDLNISMKTVGLGNMDFTVKGPMDNPAIRPALGKVVQEKGMELLKEQGKKFLNQFLK